MLAEHNNKYVRPEKGDPENGIDPGTPFEDLLEDWICPECGARKDQFEPMSE
ncbi:MAG: rubredoxin [bacterium]